MIHLRRYAAFAALVACSGCRGNVSPPLPETLALTEVVSGLNSPVFLTAPRSDARLFILEKPGRIRVFQNGALLPTPFLDISGEVSTGNEQGLLGLAFHPQYATNGFFYINFTGLDGHTRIRRYSVSTTANVAITGSAKLILQVNQPYGNHNGGMLAFGPDGMLYIGMGDGGSGGDPHGHGQDRSTLLGDMLRLNVDQGDPYVPAAGNPFIGMGSARGEIWAYGLRNPWRFSFDRSSGDLYIADVGQSEREEINVVPSTLAGVNYGWRIMEGTSCYNAATCSQTGLTLPVLDYGRTNACSVTGGYVYRGSLIPELAGHYFYSDFCGGWLRSFRYANGQATEQREWDVGGMGAVSSFGEDAAGELYVLNLSGRVFRIVKGS